MKTIILTWALFALLGTGKVLSQQIETPAVTVHLDGDRAALTIKDITAHRAIGELLDNVRLKDFRQDGPYQYYDLYINEKALTAWYIVRHQENYYLGYNDGPPLMDEGTGYTQLSEVCKVMKKIMRDHYSLYGTLDTR